MSLLVVVFPIVNSEEHYQRPGKDQTGTTTRHHSDSHSCIMQTFGKITNSDIFFICFITITWSLTA